MKFVSIWVKYNLLIRYYFRFKKIVLSSDHGGFNVKETVKDFLLKKNFQVEDVGCNSLDAVDYPDYARILSDKLKNNKDTTGILFCGTGIGISMAANRFKHIRAALCTSVEMASKSRKHNDANVLALGGRILSEKIALEIVEEFLKTDFEAGRHSLRVNKI